MYQQETFALFELSYDFKSSTLKKKRATLCGYPTKQTKAA